MLKFLLIFVGFFFMVFVYAAGDLSHEQRNSWKYGVIFAIIAAMCFVFAGRQ